MDDDWADAEDGETDFGELSAIPDVEIPTPPPQPSQPAPNAWASNQSNDVRNLIRQPTSQEDPPARRPLSLPTPTRRQPLPSADAGNPAPTSRPPPPAAAPRARRDNFSSSFASPPDRSRQNTDPAPNLFVTNLPNDVEEEPLAQFFADNNVDVSQVRLARRNDTGAIKGAVVTLAPSQDRQAALDLDGSSFASRQLVVRVDDNNRRRDRPSYTPSPSYGTFNSNKRDEQSAPPAWGTASAWTDRQPATYDNPDVRQDKRQPSLARDPSIPTGPTPAGRKKLQLKPRTKPLPVIEVDQRAIAPPKQPSVAPPPPAIEDRLSFRALPPKNAPTEGNGAGRAQNTSDRGGWMSSTSNRTSGDGQKWVNARETASPRIPSANLPSAKPSTKREEDANRPVLLNAFSALEVNDSDS